MTSHIIFDVKLRENLRKKARFCEDGHKTEYPFSLTYITIVYKYLFWILLIIYVILYIPINIYDVHNALLIAPNL